MPIRVLVLDDYQDVARTLGPWRELGDIDLDVRTTHLEGASLLEALQGADVVVAMRERTAFPRSLLAGLPALKLLVTTGMVNAAVDLDACRERGIDVRGTTGMRTATVELTWGLILALARNICAEDRRVRDGGWQHTVGVELTGARLGVIGLGRLGTEVARIGLAFGMEVTAWSQNLDAARARDLGVLPVTKDELLATSDVVTLHLKLSDRTVGIVGAHELTLMKRSAYLVNTSRGPLVDEAALVEALREHRIAGAGLDVFDVEPLPADHPLRTLPNSVLTPHIGFVTEATYAGWWQQIVDDIGAWRNNEALRQL